MRDTTNLQPLVDHALQGFRPDGETPDTDAMAIHHDRLLERLDAVTDDLAQAFERAGGDQLPRAADALEDLHRGRHANPRLSRWPWHLIAGRSRGQLETYRNIAHVNAIGVRTQIAEFAEADIARLHRLVRDFETARADWTRLLAAANTPARRVSALDGWTVCDRAFETLGRHLSALARETTLGVSEEARSVYRLADALIDPATDIRAPGFDDEVMGTRDALRARAAKLSKAAVWIRKARAAIRAANPYDHQLRTAMSGLISEPAFSLDRPPRAAVMLRDLGGPASGSGRHARRWRDGDGAGAGDALLGAAAAGVACGGSDGGGD